MARIFNRFPGLLILSAVCFIGRGPTLSAQPVVSIVPRSRPDLSVDGSPELHLRVDTPLVLIPIHAMSARGSSVTDLLKENFRLYEDGVEQRVTYFTRQDAPISVGLVFDSSGSMANKIHQSAEAAAAFFKTANASDEFFLVEFGEKPKLMMPFGSDSDQIYKQIARTKPFGRTSLIDAIHLALIQMKNARNSRKAIVLLSDGGDNRSRLTRGQIKSALLESEIQMYAMGIFDALKHTPEEKNGPQLLDELAVQSGGRLFTVDRIDDLDTVSATIGTALRNEYLLGYVSSNSSRDGKYRQVKVIVAVSPQTPVPDVSYRRGYYAPVE
jgi:Ca-activated chloride channel family protein